MAALAVIPTGLVATTAPANAATSQTAQLHHGVLRITGTQDVDLLGVVVLPPEVEVDFGLDGTVERRFPLRRVTSIEIHTLGGNDAIHLTGTGEVPLSIDTGPGFDFVSAHGRSGVTGATDALTTIRTRAGKDEVLSATPGPITIATGSGPDSVEGGSPGVGTETVSLGGGDDGFFSTMDASLGARHDVLDAGAGQDVMDVFGTTASEDLSVSANDGSLLLTHDKLASISSLGVEQLFYEGHGGPRPAGPGDTVRLGDLTGTGLLRFTPDFSANIEQTQPNDTTDRLVVTGTNQVDNISVRGVDRDIAVEGLVTLVTPIWLSTPDTLVLNTLRGKDNVDTSQLEAGLVRLEIH